MTTIFSAPDYCGKGNLGAYISTMQGDRELRFTQFKPSSETVYLLPKSQNVFEYFMIDISVWIDEFLYVLFTFLSQIKNERRPLVSAHTQEFTEEEKFYYKSIVKSSSTVAQAARNTEEGVENDKNRATGADDSLFDTEENKEGVANDSLDSMISQLRKLITEKRVEKRKSIDALKLQLCNVDHHIDPKQVLRLIRMARAATYENLSMQRPLDQVSELDKRRSQPSNEDKRPKKNNLADLATKPLPGFQERDGSRSATPTSLANNISLDVVEQRARLN